MPHLANAFKYSMSSVVTLFGAFHPLYLMQSGGHAHTDGQGGGDRRGELSTRGNNVSILLVWPVYFIVAVQLLLGCLHW